MLRPKKKITKKELKQDNLVTAYANTKLYYERHKKYISYATTALIVIVVAVVVFLNNRRANNEKATTELSKIMSVFDAGNGDVKKYRVAVDGQPERGVMGLKTIVANYGGTESGELARFYLANAYYNLGEIDDALKQFESMSSSNPVIQASDFAGIGSCYESKGDYEKAAVNFEKAANTISNSFSTPEYLNSAARCYGRANQKEKAVTLYKRIKKEYPTSTYAREVDRYIAQYSA